MLSLHELSEDHIDVRLDCLAAQRRQRLVSGMAQTTQQMGNRIDRLQLLRRDKLGFFPDPVWLSLEVPHASMPRARR